MGKEGYNLGLLRNGGRIWRHPGIIKLHMLSHPFPGAFLKIALPSLHCVTTQMRIDQGGDREDR